MFEPRKLHWRVVFYKSSEEVFDIDIKQNELTRYVSEFRNGSNYKEINTKTAKLTRYTNLSLYQ